MSRLLDSALWIRESGEMIVGDGMDEWKEFNTSNESIMDFSSDSVCSPSRPYDHAT